jgi:hypothetical protein
MEVNSRLGVSLLWLGSTWRGDGVNHTRGEKMMPESADEQVERLSRELADARRMIKLIVHQAGGSITVDHRNICYNDLDRLELSTHDDVRTGNTVVTTY